jgi:hypothetical protein
MSRGVEDDRTNSRAISGRKCSEGVVMVNRALHSPTIGPQSEV